MTEETLRASRAGNSSPFGNRLWRYGPLTLWAAAIFVFSSGLFSGSNTSSVLRPLVLWVYPNATDTGLAIVHGLVRKTSHFVEYAILALLAARAFRTSPRDFLRNHWFAVSLTFAALYALSDEFHQSFVSSRTASIYDCLIDTAGGLVALIIVRVRTARTQGPLTPLSLGDGRGEGARHSD
ncbi:MAG TPA: VanZ family protein [Pyrinomonadaceae bacterium]|nr:VanZ family protein [Pyrinomonadaceae bacterium]